MNLTTATPAEIDSALADLYDSAAALRVEAGHAASAVFTCANLRPVGTPVFRWDRHPKPEGTLTQALACCESGDGIEPYQRAAATRAAAELAQARAALATNAAEQAPLHAEFQRRGGWTRAYLVLASNGHIHKDMHCSTCFETRYDEVTGQWKEGTRYGWLPTLSGKDEAGIVEAAGADACTVCYPSAPVEVLQRPRTVLHPSEIAAARDKEGRARAAAERQRQKAAKSITNPDGSPLTVLDWTVPERAAGNGSAITPAQDRSETLRTTYAARQWLTNSQAPYATKRPEDIRRVAQALAAKSGTKPDAEIAAAAARARRRRG